VTSIFYVWVGPIVTYQIKI